MNKGRGGGGVAKRLPPPLAVTVTQSFFHASHFPSSAIQEDSVKKRAKINLPATGSELTRMLVDVYGLADGAALILAGMAGEALDTALEAESLIKKHGMVVEGERGLRANPACGIARDARNRLITALGKLNLEM